MIKIRNINPYALYIHCDAAMDYGPKSPGGVGIVIEFPDSVALEPIKLDIGKYISANIERLELEAIIKGMEEALKLYNTKNVPIYHFVFASNNQTAFKIASQIIEKKRK